MSEKTNKPSETTGKAVESQKNPFENLKPARIPTNVHNYTYQGQKEKRKENNQ